MNQKTYGFIILQVMSQIKFKDHFHYVMISQYEVDKIAAYPMATNLKYHIAENFR